MSPHGEEGGDVDGRDVDQGGPAPERGVSPHEPRRRSTSDDDTVPGTRVSITVADDHLTSLDQVVEALRRRGMRVDGVLESLGMVTGSAPDTAALREVEGVSAVDDELEYRLPSPDEEIQ